METRKYLLCSIFYLDEKTEKVSSIVIGGTSAKFIKGGSNAKINLINYIFKSAGKIFDYI